MDVSGFANILGEITEQKNEDFEKRTQTQLRSMYKATCRINQKI